MKALRNADKIYRIGGKQFRTPGAVVAPAWSPTDIAGCELWLDAEQGITKDGSNYVSTWADMSGNGNDAAQGTGDYQPLWVDATLNGKPVIRFDGLNDYLTEFTQLGKPVNYTIFMVGKIVNIGAAGTFCGSIDDSVNLETSWGLIRSIYNGVPDGTLDYLFGGGVAPHYSYGMTTTATLSSNVYALIAQKYTTTNDYTDYWVNSNSKAITKIEHSAHSTNGTGYNFKIGGGAPWEQLNGDIAEIIIYNSALSDPNRVLVEDYLNTKYTIY